MKDELVNVLIEMGVKDVFTSEADLSGISGTVGRFASNTSFKNAS